MNNKHFDYEEEAKGLWTDDPNLRRLDTIIKVGLENGWLELDGLDIGEGELVVTYRFTEKGKPHA